MTTTAIPYDDLLKENNLLKEDIKVLKEQLDWFKRQIFGQRSEKFLVNEEQLVLPGLEQLAKEGNERNYSCPCT